MAAIKKTDFLVIGSGVAGLSFSLRAAESGSVTILTKKARVDSNTNYAQGGIAAVFAPDDSFKLHAKDTESAGVGLCHDDAVTLMVNEAPDQIRDLERWGVHFTQAESQEEFDLGREGGHSKNRIVHALDKTGKVMEAAMLERVKSHPNIQVLDNHMAIDLITEHHLMGGGKSTTGAIHCWGVYSLNVSTGAVDVYLAKVTLLATGGGGRVYLHTTNPGIATGDGVAMAYRAGATMANLEFMQFHPTSLYHETGDSFLISEAVRGFGGVLISKSGEAFMHKYDKRKDLAPRDIVARAIDSEMKKSGEPCVYLDVTHLDSQKVKDHFPQIDERLLSLKIDMTAEPVPVVPAAHYMCGGILSDMYGRSDIEGLFVAGESAFTGVHGANRLASNSLLEALVFSERACTAAIEYQKQYPDPPEAIPPWDDTGTFDQEEWVLISHDLKEVQRLMWDYVGIVRSDQRLKRAKKRIRVIMNEVDSYYKTAKVTSGLLELRNVCQVASLIVKSALFRKESRGLHYTTDYPQPDDENWLGDTLLRGKKIWLQPLPSATSVSGGSD